VTTTPHAPGSTEYSLRTATADDWPHVTDILDDAFVEETAGDAWEVEHLVFEPERTILAGTPTELAGVASAFTRDLTVPGGSVPAAHVTLVGVRHTHRRRGLLRRMMSRQLADVRGRGEPVAVLWASEGQIYQRFGYGLGASRLVIEADREVRLPRPAAAGEGVLRALPAPGAEILAKVYDQVRADRVGWSSRDERWWRYVLADLPSRRDGQTRLRVTVHEGPSGVDGYALWRVKRDWKPTGPCGTVSVREMVAATPQAYLSLWRLLLDVDLTRTTEFEFAAVDEPLYHLVDQPRRLAAHLHDALWVRLVDVPAALAARCYAAEVDVVLEVTDLHLAGNSGRWHLRGDCGSASCVRTDRPADLALDVAALGAAYLGGVSLANLAAAGRVVEVAPGQLARASLAFGWYRLPAATEVF
jgi:predicted acetyltransferase